MPPRSFAEMIRKKRINRKQPACRQVGVLLSLYADPEPHRAQFRIRQYQAFAVPSAFLQRVRRAAAGTECCRAPLQRLPGSGWRERRQPPRVRSPEPCFHILFSPLFFRSDKQAHIGFFSRAEEGGNAAETDAVDQFLFPDAHNVHAHLAGDNLHPVGDGVRDQLLRRADAFFLFSQLFLKPQ